jgi:predicted TIM-barrel fold metal-dependent hydrolase
MPPVIDADTHVDESEATWEALSGASLKYRPITITAPTEGVPPGVLGASNGRWWLVDGKMQSRIIRDDEHHPPIAARELHDVQVRLNDMDRMGVETQVIFPTFFIRYDHASNPAGSELLTKAYNRWIAERCAPTKGRLQWVAVLPISDVDKAVEEMRWAKANGACGIFQRGYDLGKKASDPYFFPIYQAASELNLPLCLHTGHPGFPAREWDRGFPIMAAFTSLISSRIPERFPDLRFGFIEAGASWIPYVMSMLSVHLRSQRLHDQASTFELSRDLFRSSRLFVAIDPLDDIDYLLSLGLEDNLMIGTDYCHSDVSANLSALDEVSRWADEGRISKAVAHKILYTNPRVFYGFAAD